MDWSLARGADLSVPLSLSYAERGMEGAKDRASEIMHPVGQIAGIRKMLH